MVVGSEVTFNRIYCIYVSTVSSLVDGSCCLAMTPLPPERCPLRAGPPLRAGQCESTCEGLGLSVRVSFLPWAGHGIATAQTQRQENEGGTQQDGSLDKAERRRSTKTTKKRGRAAGKRSVDRRRDAAAKARATRAEARRRRTEETRLRGRGDSARNRKRWRRGEEEGSGQGEARRGDGGTTTKAQKSGGDGTRKTAKRRRSTSTREQEGRKG